VTQCFYKLWPLRLIRRWNRWQRKSQGCIWFPCGSHRCLGVHLFWQQLCFFALTVFCCLGLSMLSQEFGQVLVLILTQILFLFSGFLTDLGGFLALPLFLTVVFWLVCTGTATRGFLVHPRQTSTYSTGDGTKELQATFAWNLAFLPSRSLW